MFFSAKTKAGKALLWVLALAVLCFLASLHPEVRQRLPWFRPGPVEKG